jgi:hypothetical protein
MDEVRDKHLAYAAMVKTSDPGALVLGPEEWGWSGFFYSGYDQQYAPPTNWIRFQGGLVRTVGANTSGQLGDGRPLVRLTPILVTVP